MHSAACLRLMLRRFALPLLLFALSKGTDGLKIITLNMIGHVLTGQSVILECVYELEGEQLYSIKWYKDNNEFFRFVPNNSPPKQVFELPGINVNQNSSNERTVRLENLQLESSGVYQCEVSLEAPSFQTVAEEHEMSVYAAPHGLKITGVRPKYNIGDTVHTNCTARRSKPEASLEWHINGDKASPDILTRYPIIVDPNDKLETSILGLKFQVEARHFQNGDLRLNCTASISYVYQETTYVQAILGDHLRANVLESKGTPGQVQISNVAIQLRSMVWVAAAVAAALLR